MDDAFIQSLKEVFGGNENKKNLVDPFIEARFAGKKVPNHSSLKLPHIYTRGTMEGYVWLLSSVQLCTQIIERNANPEWNQVLNLQVKVIHFLNLNSLYQSRSWQKTVFCSSSPPCASVSNWQSLIGKSRMKERILLLGIEKRLRALFPPCGQLDFALHGCAPSPARWELCGRWVRLCWLLPSVTITNSVNPVGTVFLLIFITVNSRANNMSDKAGGKWMEEEVRKKGWVICRWKLPTQHA